MGDYKKIFIFLILFISLPFYSRAQSTYVDFSLDSYLLKNNHEFEVDFNYKISDGDVRNFYIRPLIGNGSVEIYDSEKNTWIGTSSFFLSLPKLKDLMQVKFSSVNVEKTDMWFEIKDIKNGELYTTPKKTVWTEKVYDNYLESLNSNLKNYSITEEDTEDFKTNIIDVVKVRQTKLLPVSILDFLDNIPKKYFLYASIFCFFTSAIIGFFTHKKVAAKKMVKSICD